MTRMMNLTAAFGLSALMALAPGCSGSKSDTSEDSGEVEADADADTDSDSDTDTEPTYFDDYIVTFNVFAGFDGFELTDYYLELGGDANPPFARLTFYEEAYIETGDESYTCQYEGLLSVEEPLDLGVEDAWLGNNVTLVGGQSDCANFDPARFGLDGTPIEAVESLSFGLGFGPLTENLETQLSEIYADQGADWATEGKPYAFTGYFAFTFDGGETFETIDLNYASAYLTDDDLVIEEEDGAYFLYDGMDSAEELPYPSLVQSSAFYGMFTEALFP